ncbi:MAG: tetraacyldisaccharide 4'-kinase [Pseudomonadota bacterium]
MPSARELIVQSWASRGPLALALWPLSLVMGCLVGLRRTAYRWGLLHDQSPGLPVLVVGNRVVGGAGKTPTTVAIVQYLQHQGWTPGVLSRGYKQSASAAPLTLIDQASAHRLTAAEVGDEPLLIWRRTQAPLMVGRDRVAGGVELRKHHPQVDILICDDGLQHLRLKRQIEVVVFDERGAGNGWLLPAGPLRESIHAPAPSSLVAPPIVIYNASKASSVVPGYLGHRHLAPWKTLEQWWDNAPADPTAQPPQQGCWAVAGIAHPPKFFTQLQSLGWSTHPVACADHDPYTTLPWPLGITNVILTEKDAIKLSLDRVHRERPGTQVWVAALDFSPEPGFWQTLDHALKQLPTT